MIENWKSTVHVNSAGIVMADLAFGCLEEVIEADSEADFLDDLCSS